SGSSHLIGRTSIPKSSRPSAMVSSPLSSKIGSLLKDSRSISICSGTSLSIRPSVVCRSTVLPLPHDRSLGGWHLPSLKGCRPLSEGQNVLVQHEVALGQGTRVHRERLASRPAGAGAL